VIKVGLVVLATVLGAVLHKFNIPIPWILGGILAALIVQIVQTDTISWSKKIRDYALLVIGYGTGRYVDFSILDVLSGQAIGIVTTTLVSVIACIFVSLCMTKFQQLDFHSVLMGILPGGFTQMTAMVDDDKRINPNIVTVYQSLRLLTIVVSVPFMVINFLGASVSNDVATLTYHGGIPFWLVLPFTLVGAMLFTKLGMAIPYLLGSIAVAASAALIMGKLNTPPDWLMTIAQLYIGIYVGAGLNVKELKKIAKTLPAVFAGIGFMLLVSVAFAYFLSDYYGFSLITAFLAMAPGGLAEMCLTGISTGENVTIILTYQLFRFLFLNLAVPPAMIKYFGPSEK